MKKFLIAVLLALISLAGGAAHADTCQTQLMPLFNSYQSVALCTKLPTSVSTTTKPQTDNAIDLGSASKQWRTLYTGTSIVNAGQTTTNGLVTTSTNEEAVAGAGTTVADAAALSATKHLHQLTGANGTVGWKFSSSTPVGSVEILLNTTAGVPKIYGESGSTCNGGATDAACTLVTGIAPHICWKSAALTYICS
jgi:hypothetical protein